MATKPIKQATPLDPGALPWLLACALATSAPHAEHLPLWLSALAGLFLLWRTYLWRSDAPLPTRWSLALLVATGVGGIGWEFHTLFGRDAGVALLVLFMALKPMEMRTQRDAMVVVMLGFFLLLTHYFYSQSIPTGLWLLAATALLTATLIRIHGGAQPVSAVFRYASLLLIQAIPFMVIAFLLFPRVAGPLWGLPQDAYSGLTGLSDQMSPGSLNNLIQSGEIAFRVQFIGPTPAKTQLYWRGPVLSDYDGKIWRTRAPHTATLGKAPQIEAHSPPVSYVTTLEANNQRWLLALDLPVKQPEDTRLANTFELRSREPIVARTRFAISSVLGFTANREETPAMLQQSLRLPPGYNPRARELAQEWKDQNRSPEKISDAALKLFRNENFYYTLRPPLLGENAIDEFLFGSRRGFCEHYASAYVFLMRAAGVPARVVTGYQGGETNPVDGYLVVRQSDAHAWAEIWLAKQGWVRVDPTAAVAPSRIERGIDAALPENDPLPALVRINANWLRDLRNRWEAINNGWNQWVLGYNPQRQREMLMRFGLNDPDWRNMTAALTMLCGIALLAVSLWTLYRRDSDTPEQSAWRAFCKQLARHGIRRADWEGPLDFARRVAQERPAFSALVGEAAGHFADLHYGKGKPQQLQQLKECTLRLKKIRPPSWRHPF